MTEDYAHRREEILDMLRENKGDRGQLLEMLEGLERFLGIKKPDDEPYLTGDPVTDEWEKAIADGRIPDDWVKAMAKSGKKKQDGPKALKPRR